LAYWPLSSEGQVISLVYPKPICLLDSFFPSIIIGKPFFLNEKWENDVSFQLTDVVGHMVLELYLVLTDAMVNGPFSSKVKIMLSLNFTYRSEIPVVGRQDKGQEPHIFY